MTMRLIASCALAGGLAVVIGTMSMRDARAQAGVFAYPMAGQNQQQQSRDRFDCHGWAVQQTGYDPTRSQAAAAPPRPAYAPPPPQQRGIFGLGQGGMFRDAAKGAALGAAGGAIAGDAGKGAAIGMLTTTLFGGIRRRNRQQQEQAWRAQQQQQAMMQQQQYAQQNQALASNYRRAYSACMSARNYRVQ